jgi:hypothetical protein
MCIEFKAKTEHFFSLLYSSDFPHVLIFVNQNVGL